ncbi:hypothetical protein, partial [Candidatus Poriferisocius sp.]|uniref:hypothetical protein n=1 Tax=Candidatus Poriferisocius sp. TaxID=3101276 RepID=UPI003B018FA5
RSADVISAVHSVATDTAATVTNSTAHYLQNLTWTTISLDKFIELKKIDFVEFFIRNNDDAPDRFSQLISGQVLRGLKFNPGNSYAGDQDTTIIKALLMWDWLDDGPHLVHQWRKAFLRTHAYSHSAGAPVLLMAPLTDGVYLTGFKADAWNTEHKIDRMVVTYEE